LRVEQQPEGWFDDQAPVIVMGPITQSQVWRRLMHLKEMITPPDADESVKATVCGAGPR